MTVLIAPGARRIMKGVRHSFVGWVAEQSLARNRRRGFHHEKRGIRRMNVDRLSDCAKLGVGGHRRGDLRVVRRIPMGVTALVLALAVCRSSFGADPSAAEIAKARRLFAEARTDEDSKDWAGAIAKLRGAMAIKETAGLRFHLAYCEEQQNKLVEALADYERSEDLGKQSNDDFVVQLPARRETLHKRIPTLTILTPPSVSDVVLSVDGRVVPSAFLGKPMALNPGRHKIEASAPGRAEFSTEVSLGEGDALVTSAPLPSSEEQRAVSPPLFPAAAVAAPAPPPTADKRRGSSAARTVVLVGESMLVAAGLGIGIGYTLGAASADSNANQWRPAGADVCRTNADGSPPTDEKCANLGHFVDLGQKDRFVALLGFVGAGVSAVALAGTFILWPSGAAKTAIVPYPTASGAGLSVVGRF
jgi:hypothetical protein